MRKLTIQNTEVQIPSSWNELTPEQVLHICALYNKGGDVATIKVLIFFHLSGLKVTGKDSDIRPAVYQVELNGEKHMLKVEDITFAANQSTDFILKRINGIGGKPATYTISSTLTKNPLAECAGLIGPSDALGNITWGEFCSAQTHYSNYAATQNVIYLHKLIAVLWRSRVVGLSVVSDNYNGDLRQPFNDFKVDLNAVEIKKRWKPSQITAAKLFYEGCLAYIVREYKELFQGNNAPSKTKPDAFKNMLRLTLAAAGNEETKMAQVLDDPAHQVLFAITEALRANIKAEEQIKQQRNGRK